MEKPLLRRDIQAIAVNIDGRRMIRFHDPYQLVDGGIAVDMAMLPLLQMLSGNHDLRDIQLLLMKSCNGSMVYLSDIEALVQSLDRAGLLESDLFHEKMRKLKDGFINSRTRSPVHAGRAYPSDPGEMAHFIEGIERDLPDPPLEGGRSAGGETVLGVLAPHIDIQVAGKTYVDVYRRLKGPARDLVIVLGINHQPQKGLYCLSEKAYTTPFGEIRPAESLIADLKKRVPPGTLDPDDFGHKMEHSIEFQTVFLHYYLGESFSLLPILCGSTHEFLLGSENLLTDSRFLGMAGALQEMLAAHQGRVLLVAGVDLSHVGPKFGDPLPAVDLLARARTAEEEMLSHLACGEPEKIMAQARDSGDRFHVCGLPAILLFSTLMKGKHGHVLGHETYDEPATQSAVNYAAMIFGSGG